MSIPMTKPEVTNALVGLALERAQFEYTECADNWKLLDAKAQGTAAITGIFLAAVVAFIGRDACSQGTDIHMKITAAALLTLLLLSIMSSVFALRVVEFDMPPSGRSTKADVDRLLQLDLGEDQLREGRLLLLKELTEIWLACNDKLDSCNERKGRWIRRAQLCLAGAAVAGSMIAMWRLLS